MTHTHTHTHTFGRTPGQRIGPSQRPLPDTQHSQDTSMSTAGFVSGILSKRAAADPRLSQRGRQNSHRRNKYRRGQGSRDPNGSLLRCAYISYPVICALFGCYAAYCGNSVPTFRENLPVPPSRVPSGHSPLRNIPEECRGQERVGLLPLLPLWAFMACYGSTFTFTFRVDVLSASRRKTEITDNLSCCAAMIRDSGSLCTAAANEAIVTGSDDS